MMLGAFLALLRSHSFHTRLVKLIFHNATNQNSCKNMPAQQIPLRYNFKKVDHSSQNEAASPPPLVGASKCTPPESVYNLMQAIN